MKAQLRAELIVALQDALADDVRLLPDEARRQLHNTLLFAGNANARLLLATEVRL